VEYRERGRGTEKRLRGWFEKFSQMGREGRHLVENERRGRGRGRRGSYGRKASGPEEKSSPKGGGRDLLLRPKKVQKLSEKEVVERSG